MPPLENVTAGDTVCTLVIEDASDETQTAGSRPASSRPRWDAPAPSPADGPAPASNVALVDQHTARGAEEAATSGGGNTARPASARPRWAAPSSSDQSARPAFAVAGEVTVVDLRGTFAKKVYKCEC